MYGIFWCVKLWQTRLDFWGTQLKDIPEVFSREMGVIIPVCLVIHNMYSNMVRDPIPVAQQTRVGWTNHDVGGFVKQ